MWLNQRVLDIKYWWTRRVYVDADDIIRVMYLSTDSLLATIFAVASFFSNQNKQAKNLKAAGLFGTLFLLFLFQLTMLLMFKVH